VSEGFAMWAPSLVLNILWDIIFDSVTSYSEVHIKGCLTWIVELWVTGRRLHSKAEYYIGSSYCDICTDRLFTDSQEHGMLRIIWYYNFLGHVIADVCIVDFNVGR
jgi:hypothetical protein